MITDIIVDAIRDIMPVDGLLNIFILHTSAAIAINENADPSVLLDFESFFNKLVPENCDFVLHDIEGPDDMPAHVKSVLAGTHCTIPVVNGKLALGTWQGIYLCEFRNMPHRRKLILTIYS